MNAASNTKKTSPKKSKQTENTVRQTSIGQASHKAAKTSATKAVTNARRGAAPQISGLDDLLIQPAHPVAASTRKVPAVTGLPTLTESTAYHVHSAQPSKKQATKLFATLAVVFFVTLIAVGSVLFFGLFFMSEDQVTPRTPIAATPTQNIDSKIKVYGPPLVKKEASVATNSASQALQTSSTATIQTAAITSTQPITQSQTAAATVAQSMTSAQQLADLSSNTPETPTAVAVPASTATVAQATSTPTVAAAQALSTPAVQSSPATTVAQQSSSITAAPEDSKDNSLLAAQPILENAPSILENANQATSSEIQTAISTTSVAANEPSTALQSSSTESSNISTIDTSSSTDTSTSQTAPVALLTPASEIEIPESTFDMFIPPAEALVGLNAPTQNQDSTPSLQQTASSMTSIESANSNSPRARISKLIQDKADLINPQTQSWLEIQNIKGVVSRGQESRMLLNNKIFLIGDVVDFPHKLVWVGIDASDKRLYFKDHNGAYYSMNY
ncbi:MAG: hypothetical protein A2Y14_04120 [Verrucomicrobia bacterium GWF2_51_19]|nr:MAG: hypothetical protein A2Y14_04120 [Verrucomicrobia bacterium GWF2_51_19]HCJ11796.1 hypothetical protein [Opitutae bacterium]